MSRINTNLPALRAMHRLGSNQDELQLRLTRLSSGLRINRGRDDPAGLIASERLRSEMRGLQQAIDNSARASNVVTTAEGALNEVSALLLDVQQLLVEGANQAGHSADEVRANQLQIDSILASIDRIANTTEFAGRKLLDGREDYLLSTIPTTAFSSVAVYAAHVPQGGTRNVKVQVTQSATTGRLNFVGRTIGATSTTSATTIEIRGTLGAQVLSFLSGASLADIRTSINNITALTGVSAIVSAASTGGVASALVLNSATFGSDAFISLQPLSGNFVTGSNTYRVYRDDGSDATVLVDGQRASVRGFVADVRSPFVDARIRLSNSFGQKLSSATFRITGGGALFQITPQINPNGQISIGFNSIHTTQLGDAATGLLYTLGSGRANDLASKKFSTAQSILTEAINQVASFRGRLGNVHRNLIEPLSRSQMIALENVTASESVIRDADMAVEVSGLTRAQILVQSTQRTLEIANSIPSSVLTLLG
ncbi:MAG: flagellin [Planctomycetota bacterium]